MVFFMSRGLPSNKTYDPVFANNDWAAIIEHATPMRCRTPG